MHTWGGDYLQQDSIVYLAIEKDFNYIHPNFRGKNNTKDACCSNKAITDIDDAIDYMITYNKANPKEIYVIGASGGGYATLCSYMKSKFSAKKYAAWAPIADLESWYSYLKQSKYDFEDDILNCIPNNDFKSRSPLFWKRDSDKSNESKLHIFAGIRDGLDGSVPFIQSINFFNKMTLDEGGSTIGFSISDEEISLLEQQKQVEIKDERINGRLVYLKKQTPSLGITIFEGGHEILLPYAFNELIKD